MSLADPSKVEERARQEKESREQELADFQFIMENPQGRRFMMRMLDMTGFQKSSFTGNSTTFFNEGQRNIGLQLWADIQEFPQLYLKMLLEQKEKEKRNARR